MANDDRTKIIPRRTPESATMLASVERAMAITSNLNRLTFNDAEEVRALFNAGSRLSGRCFAEISRLVAILAMVFDRGPIPVDANSGGR